MRRHTRCAVVTGVQTCALPICVRWLLHGHLSDVEPVFGSRLSRRLHHVDTSGVAANRTGQRQGLSRHPGCVQARFARAGDDTSNRLFDIPGRDRERLPEYCRSEEHTSELQSLMRISYAVFCLKKKKKSHSTTLSTIQHQVISP